MKDKKDFGKFIAEKRKELSLTQEELANKLFVLPSTISKWERGVTYPDITMVTNLCRELNISEHQLFMSSNEELDDDKKKIQLHIGIRKWMVICLNIIYFISLFISFICNLVIQGSLSWFYIVLVSILISFTITSLHFYFINNKYKWFKISIIFTFLVYLLLFVINFVTDGSWLLDSFKIASFIFLLFWLGVIVCIFTNLCVNYKVSICLVLLSIVIMFTFKCE